jgi:hypothetical protein
MYFDGSLMKSGAGVGLIFVSPLGMRMRYMIRIHFPASNNVAEYEALVNTHRHRARDLMARRLWRLAVDRGPSHERVKLS